MRYLKKKTDSKVLSGELKYDQPSHRSQIRALLIDEQNRYCAYSERFCLQTDQCDIEHFDPRLKSTDQDSYWNWYAVIVWMNSHKPKNIEPFLPLPKPHDSSLVDRIRFRNGLFESVIDGDIEAKNLISYLGWNKESLVKDRNAHLERLRFIREYFPTINEFVEYIQSKNELSFATAIEVEFGIQL